MSLQAGFVGLPNVGKSTIFNALTNSSVSAENYPFCTIDPSSACAVVPDSRLDRLQKIYGSEKKISTVVEFVDIAGLIKGAAQGEGLGNKFLGHIREVSLILYVARCFKDSSVIRDQGNLDPLGDFQTIYTELALKDLESIEGRLAKIPSLMKKNSGPKEKELFSLETDTLEQLKEHINQGSFSKASELAKKEECTHLSLLLAKPVVVIANIDEDDVSLADYSENQYVKQLYDYFGKDRVIPVSAKLESDLSKLSDEDAAIYMEEYNLSERGLSKIIRAVYEYLGYITFFTCGPKEAHAWQIPKGITIKEAAGFIHSDLEKGFISAHVHNEENFLSGEYTNEQELKQAGKIRMVGSDYIVNDGDIVHVLFNV